MSRKIPREHLLLKLMEECAEVAQRASKSIEFGRKQMQRGKPDNRERLRMEVLDMLAIVALLEADGEFDEIGLGELNAHVEIKAAKLRKFRGLSKRLAALR